MTEAAADFIKILGAVALALGGKEGFALIRMRYNGKKHGNPTNERRSSLLTAEDREFLRLCFKDQKKTMEDCLVHQKRDLELWMMHNLKE